MKLSIKKGAIVEVIAGAQKGARGTVLSINKPKKLIKVQGVKVQTHYDKEGFKKLEGFVDYSNVRLVEQAPAFKKETKKKSKKA